MRYSPFILRAPASSAELGKAKPLQLLKKPQKLTKLVFFMTENDMGCTLKQIPKEGGKFWILDNEMRAFQAGTSSHF